MDIREILSFNLRKFRSECGFTQEKLADKANSSSNYIAMIELRKKFPSPEMIERLAKALNIECYEFFSAPQSLSNNDVCDIKKFQRLILRDLEDSVAFSVEKTIRESIEKSLEQVVEQAVTKTINSYKRSTC